MDSHTPTAPDPAADHPLHLLPPEQHEDAIERTMVALMPFVRRLMLLYLLDYPMSQPRHLHAGVERRLGKRMPYTSTFHAHLKTLRQAGLILAHPKGIKRPHTSTRHRTRRLEVSPYGVRWLRHLYGDGALRASALPDNHGRLLVLRQPDGLLQRPEPGRSAVGRTNHPHTHRQGSKA